MKQNEHGRIIATVAKKHLAPLGCRRKGQSRVWLLDHGYWIVLIEFQPSSWSKGSYLNVGASWLWSKPGPLGFHHGNRVGNLFISYESQEQFEPQADALAARAAEEVRRLNDECNSLEKIAAILLEKVAQDARHEVFHAGIAAGLVGRLAEAKQSFQTAEDFGRREQTRPWVRELGSASTELRGLLDNPEAYTNTVEDMIQRQRLRNRLPELPRALPRRDL